MPHTNSGLNHHLCCAHQSLASSEVLQGPTASFQGGVLLGLAQ